jgi:hypothetical protein
VKKEDTYPVVTLWDDIDANWGQIPTNSSREYTSEFQTELTPAGKSINISKNDIQPVPDTLEQEQTLVIKFLAL